MSHSNPSETDVRPNDIQSAVSKFIDNMGKVIVGKKSSIELLFIALLCEGHVLIEDVPGLGKTLLAKAASRSLDLRFKRIQCTPDLLPSDVVGTNFFNQRTQDFEFRPGPVIANLVLVDEINRAMPRTQSCLLECMQEHQVTVEMETRALPRPFLLIATQNPIEFEGTFPLPEAQLDRFMLKVTMGYPDEDEEDAILTRFKESDPLEQLTSILDADEIKGLQTALKGVYVNSATRGYITAIVRATRNHDDIKLGASPRASMYLQQAAQASAAIQGRDYATPDDVKASAAAVIAHRIVLKTEARLKGISGSDLVGEILTTIPVPDE